MIASYHRWRTSAPLSDPNWEPKFSTGLPPVGVLLWVKLPKRMIPVLCRRPNYVVVPPKKGQDFKSLVEYEIESTGEKVTGAYEWCIY